MGGRVLFREVDRMLSHSPHDDTAGSILTTFRCPAPWRAAMEREAATEYLPVAAVIRRAVAHYLAAQGASRATP
jgi:hypothetical protein